MPVDRHIVANSAIKALQKHIRNGKWDTYLPSERMLASQLNIGRSTLRKALVKLTEDKWLDAGVSGKRRRILDIPVTPLLTPSTLEKQANVIWLTSQGMIDRGRLALPIYSTLNELLTGDHVDIDILQIPKRCLSHPDRHLERFVNEHSATVWVIHSLPKEVRAWFANSEHSFVVAGGVDSDERVSSVTMDLSAAINQALDILIEKGHENIVYLQSDSGCIGDVESLQIFNERTAKIRSASAQLSEDPEISFNALHKIYSKVNNAPTAIITDQSSKALAALSWLQSFQVKVPKQVSLITLRSRTLIEYAYPAISHFTYPEDQASALLHQWCLSIINGAELGLEHVKLQPTFVEASSI